MNQPPHSPSLFHGRHFDRSIIILCVRWYITYKLSYRDLVEMMAERGLSMAHTTIMRWVQGYASQVRTALDAACDTGGPILASR